MKVWIVIRESDAETTRVFATKELAIEWVNRQTVHSYEIEEWAVSKSVTANGLGYRVQVPA